MGYIINGLSVKGVIFIHRFRWSASMVRNIIISQYVYNTSIPINKSNLIRLLYCIKNVHVLYNMQKFKFL